MYKFPFKTCFVITPYGIKSAPHTVLPAAGEAPRPATAIDESSTTINFEYVYENIIVKALSDIVPHTRRSKDLTNSGVIHEEMFRQIISADVVICDISLLNANVMYELGVRHAARSNGTIIVKQKDGQHLPFNLNLARVVTYRVPAMEADDKPQSSEFMNEIAEAQQLLRKFVVRALETRKVDSPVHALIPNLNLMVPAKRLETIAVGTFPLDPDHDRSPTGQRMNPKESADQPSTSGGATGVSSADDGGTLLQSLETYPATSTKTTSKRWLDGRRVMPKIGIATGNLRDIYDSADVWVNPENTRMEMGPMFGETVSSYIRVLGATSRDQSLGSDDVQKCLRWAMGRSSNVLPGRSLMTRAGALAHSHGVRRIVHVAAQEGFPLSGFSTVDSVGTCVESALEEIERFNASWLRRLRFRPLLRRVLIPLFGTRNPRSNPVEVTRQIVLAAKRHLDLERDSHLERVLFLATTDHDLELCETAFQRLGYRLEDLSWEHHSLGEKPVAES